MSRVGLSYNLNGTILSMGIPVNGTTVKLYDYWHTAVGLQKHFVSEITTGPKGTFNFDVRKGLYSLEVIPNKDSRFARQSVDSIKVTANTTCNITLKAGAIVKGTASTAEGKSLACDILFFGSAPDFIKAEESTAIDGSYSVSLLPGKYYVALRYRPPVEMARRSRPEQAFFSPLFQIIDIERDCRQDLKLPELVLLEGTITDTKGQPAPDVLVTIYPAERAEHKFAKDLPMAVSCITNGGGKFECTLKAGIYNIRLQPDAESHLAERTINAIQIDQPRVRTYPLDPGYTWRGKVLHDNTPVPNARISVFGVKGESMKLTDEAGNFSFSLASGRYDFQVSVQQDPLNENLAPTLAPATGEFILDSDSVFNINLAKGYSINGRVLDHKGNPRVGASLFLFANYPSRAGDSALCRTPLAESFTDEAGIYEFNLNSGQYKILMNNQSSTTQFIEVVDSHIQKDLSFHDACVVTLVIVSELEEPQMDCSVILQPFETHTAGLQSAPQQSALRLTTHTGHEGTCNLTIPAGIYSLTVSPPEGSSCLEKHIRQLSINSDITKRIKLTMRN